MENAFFFQVMVNNYLKQIFMKKNNEFIIFLFIIKVVLKFS